MAELPGAFKKKAVDFFNYTSRDSLQLQKEKAEYLTSGDSVADSETKNTKNTLILQSGNYGILNPGKPDTTIVGSGDIDFNSAEINVDCKITNSTINGGTVVNSGATAIFSNCTFLAPITVIGNSHFIGCLFQGAINNTGTTYIIGCSNKSGAAHVGVPAGNIFGETT
jgi:hypothetical protein